MYTTNKDKINYIWAYSYINKQVVEYALEGTYYGKNEKWQAIPYTVPTVDVQKINIKLDC
jgi:hypothetical protein